MTPKSLQANIIFLCGDFTHLFHQALTAAFKRNDITVTIEQFSILAVLFYQNGINQKELGTILGRDKTTVTRIISNMMRSKLVRRTADKADGRGKLIYLTAKGKTIQKKAVTVSGELYQKTLENIPQRKLGEAISLIREMTKNIHS